MSLGNEDFLNTTDPEEELEFRISYTEESNTVPNMDSNNESSLPTIDIIPEEFTDYKFDFNQGQQGDEDIALVKSWLLSGTERPPLPPEPSPWLQNLWKEFSRLSISSDGLVYHTNLDPNTNLSNQRILVPKSFVPKLLYHFHGAPLTGHVAKDVAATKARQICYWPGMTKDIEKHCTSCLPCQYQSNPVPGYKAPLRPIKVTRPFQKVAVDITELPLTSQGNRYVITCCDLFTKHINLYPS